MVAYFNAWVSTLSSVEVTSILIGEAGAATHWVVGPGARLVTPIRRCWSSKNDMCLKDDVEEI